MILCTKVNLSFCQWKEHHMALVEGKQIPFYLFYYVLYVVCHRFTFRVTMSCLCSVPFCLTVKGTVFKVFM